MNSSVLQDSLLGPNFILLFINDRPRDILILLINTYADDTTVYGSAPHPINLYLTVFKIFNESLQPLFMANIKISFIL